MYIKTLVGLAATALMCACANVVRVQSETATATTKHSGIPFFKKTEQFRQVTVHRETWYMLTLKVEKKLVETKDGKEVLLDRGTQSFLAEAQDINTKEIIAIKSAIVRANTSDVNDALSLISKFQALPPRSGAVNAAVVTNEIVSEWLVDSSRTYYLNAPLPWFGTGSLTQKFNSDGTLAETVASADTKLSEGLSALLPMKEYLSGEFIDPAPAANADPSKAADVQKGVRMFLHQGGTRDLTSKQYVYLISLSTDEVGYDVTLKSAPAATRPTLGAALAVGAAGVSMTKKTLPTKDEPPKEDAPTIGISGNIKLPKPK